MVWVPAGTSTPTRLGAIITGFRDAVDGHASSAGRTTPSAALPAGRFAVTVAVNEPLTASLLARGTAPGAPGGGVDARERRRGRGRPSNATAG